MKANFLGTWEGEGHDFKKPSEVWQEYQKALQFNEGIELVEKVKNNENFFLGRQWGRVSTRRIWTSRFLTF